MATEHWFDALNKLLVSGTPRRSALLAASALAADLALHGVGRADAGKSKKKQKNKKKHGKGKKDKPKSCSVKACQREFESQDDRDWCEFICRQCDGADPRQFCIVTVIPGGSEKVATCCVEGAVCCEQRCQSGPSVLYSRCCEGAWIDTRDDDNNCGACGNRCGPGLRCSEGVCRAACGGGACSSDPNEQCCNDICRDVLTHQDHCGACGRACPGYQPCIGGICRCPDGETFCDSATCDGCAYCIDGGRQCCGVTAGCEPGEECCGSGAEAQCCEPDEDCCGSGSETYCYPRDIGCP